MLDERQAFQAFLLRLGDLPVVRPFRRTEDDPQKLNFPLPKCHFETPVPQSRASSAQPQHDASRQSEAASRTVSLKVKAMKAGYVYHVSAEPLTAIRDLKHQLAAQCSVPAEFQRLLLKGKALADGSLVSDYALTAESVVTLMVKPGAPSPQSPPPPMPPTTGNTSDSAQPTQNRAKDAALPTHSNTARALQSSAFKSDFCSLLDRHGVAPSEQTRLVDAIHRLARS
ncbi:hypothetical protein H4R34_004402 [Dimargaris verticillata]|uniref:Ubiquitin-like domain-containing protein n=1 Tax=Dimargaris verticillata TaxID=2761393 RepID=A0A9W8AYC6_9FUNG|nr:hypothetical protein H4R34_004402 [Dimargaris verticillata]